MALIQVNFMSKTLFRNVTMNVILPVDKITFPGAPIRENKPYKTLYLLHGVFGNYTDWISGSNIQRLAEKNNLAVVMPSGDNSFYVDNPKSQNNYGEFIGKELVEITRKMFPLSNKREDTYIAGLSMGGYGAIRNGLKYNLTFGCIAGLSSALITDNIDRRNNNTKFFLESRNFAEACFGDLSKVAQSDKNPVWIAEKILEENEYIPKIYMACGDKDSLLEANIKFNEKMKSLGIDITFEIGPGGHEWDFWNTYIARVLEWLSLENSTNGINSGSIGI